MADDTKTVAKTSDILPQAYEQLAPADETMINNALQVFGLIITIIIMLIVIVLTCGTLGGPFL